MKYLVVSEILSLWEILRTYGIQNPWLRAEAGNNAGGWRYISIISWTDVSRYNNFKAPRGLPFEILDARIDPDESLRIALKDRLSYWKMDGVNFFRVTPSVVGEILELCARYEKAPPRQPKEAAPALQMASPSSPVPGEKSRDRPSDRPSDRATSDRAAVKRPAGRPKKQSTVPPAVPPIAKPPARVGEAQADDPATPRSFRRTLPRGAKKALRADFVISPTGELKAPGLQREAEAGSSAIDAAGLSRLAQKVKALATAKAAARERLDHAHKQMFAELTAAGFSDVASLVLPALRSEGACESLRAAKEKEVQALNRDYDARLVELFAE